MERIFHQSQDESTGRYLIIEEDKDSIWAYLTFPNDVRIEKDCFMASRKEIITESIEEMGYWDQGAPPPLIKSYSTEESVKQHLEEADISSSWRDNGKVIVSISNQPFLYFLPSEKRGFSKAISKDGMFGNCWNEVKYQQEFL